MTDEFEGYVPADPQTAPATVPRTAAELLGDLEARKRDRIEAAERLMQAEVAYEESRKAESAAAKAARIAVDKLLPRRDRSKPKVETPAAPKPGKRKGGEAKP